ncbi:MAG: hypothetical protein ACI9YL_000804 [Luteibaculaceae bacterium]|jgi:hypothetical protein
MDKGIFGRHSWVTLILTLVTLVSCENKEIRVSEDISVRQYVFLGHPYDWAADTKDRIDPRLIRLNTRDYDELWLGGDVCVRTTEKAETMYYVDSVFGISDTNRVHWCLGNHDIRNGDPRIIENYLGRNSYHSHNSHGITKVFLNTNTNNLQVPELVGDVELERRQVEFIKNVFDTITTSDHLIVFAHHTIFQEIPELESRTIPSNVHIPNYSFSSEAKLTFPKFIYPYLKAIVKRGVKVWWVCGDFGMNAKSFRFQDANGITFLGQGVNNSVLQAGYIPPYVNNFDPDNVLVFRHLENGNLFPSFQNLDSLLFVRGL